MHRKFSMRFSELLKAPVGHFDGIAIQTLCKISEQRFRKVEGYSVTSIALT